MKFRYLTLQCMVLVERSWDFRDILIKWLHCSFLLMDTWLQEIKEEWFKSGLMTFSEELNQVVLCTKFHNHKNNNNRSFDTAKEPSKLIVITFTNIIFFYCGGSTRMDKFSFVTSTHSHSFKDISAIGQFCWSPYGDLLFSYTTKSIKAWDLRTDNTRPRFIIDCSSGLSNLKIEFFSFGQ
jgi:hypothetical protein